MHESPWTWVGSSRGVGDGEGWLCLSRRGAEAKCCPRWGGGQIRAVGSSIGCPSGENTPNCILNIQVNLCRRTSRFNTNHTRFMCIQLSYHWCTIEEIRLHFFWNQGRFSMEVHRQSSAAVLWTARGHSPAHSATSCPCHGRCAAGLQAQEGWESWVLNLCMLQVPCMNSRLFLADDAPSGGSLLGTIPPLHTEHLEGLRIKGVLVLMQSQWKYLHYI